jgi:ATP-dependent Clp protease ATP-binding subunit ClpC
MLVGVFERLTKPARHVVVRAQEEARSLKHNHVGTEHLLLGLLGEEEGRAAGVLASLGVTFEGARRQVVRIVGAGEKDSPDQMPFTTPAKQSLERALHEALSLGRPNPRFQPTTPPLTITAPGLRARSPRQRPTPLG